MIRFESWKKKTQKNRERQRGTDSKTVQKRRIYNQCDNIKDTLNIIIMHIKCTNMVLLAVFNIFYDIPDIYIYLLVDFLCATYFSLRRLPMNSIFGINWVLSINKGKNHLEEKKMARLLLSLTRICVQQSCQRERDDKCTYTKSVPLVYIECRCYLFVCFIFVLLLSSSFSFYRIWKKERKDKKRIE